MTLATTPDLAIEEPTPDFVLFAESLGRAVPGLQEQEPAEPDVAEEHVEQETAADDHAEAEDHAFQMPEELPNIYSLYEAITGGGSHAAEGQEAEGGHHAPFWVNPLFSFFYAGLFVVVVVKILKKSSVETPSRAQVALEGIFSGLFSFFGEVIGEKHARKFVPFVGTLWIFILLNNWFGLIPLFKSPTAHFQTTLALALCTFCYVNFHGIREGGIKHYIWHLSGSPTDMVGYAMVPVMLPLEIVGTLVKPISLALRLFGNIFGEDKLLASFLGLGLMMTGFIFKTTEPWVGIPMHFPFLFLATLTSVIQATVFSVLAAVYISLLLPHEHEGGHGAEEGGEGHTAAAA